MQFDYVATAQDAASMLAEFGALITLRTEVLGPYDPATGGSTQTATDVLRNGVLLDFASGLTNGTGGLIEIGDKRLLLEVGTKPKLQDKVIVVGGSEYVIKGVGEVNPAGVPVLYDLHLKT